MKRIWVYRDQGLSLVTTYNLYSTKEIFLCSVCDSGLYFSIIRKMLNFGLTFCCQENSINVLRGSSILAGKNIFVVKYIAKNIFKEEI